MPRPPLHRRNPPLRRAKESNHVRPRRRTQRTFQRRLPSDRREDIVGARGWASNTTSATLHSVSERSGSATPIIQGTGVDLQYHFRVTRSERWAVTPQPYSHETSHT